MYISVAKTIVNGLIADKEKRAKTFRDLMRFQVFTELSEDDPETIQLVTQFIENFNDRRQELLEKDMVKPDFWELYDKHLQAKASAELLRSRTWMWITAEFMIYAGLIYLLWALLAPSQ